MLELVFMYILKNNYQSYDFSFWFEVHCRVGLNITQIELLAILGGGDALYHCDKIMQRPLFWGWRV
jgi:hypothetical protein